MSSKKKIGLFLLLVMTSLIPYSVNAKTIKDFENEVNNFTKSLEEKEAKIAKNDQEVAVSYPMMKLKRRLKKVNSYFNIYK